MSETCPKAFAFIYLLMRPRRHVLDRVESQSIEGSYGAEACSRSRIILPRFTACARGGAAADGVGESGHRRLRAGGGDRGGNRHSGKGRECGGCGSRDAAGPERDYGRRVLHRRRGGGAGLRRPVPASNNWK